MSANNETAGLDARTDDCGLVINPFRASRLYHDDPVGIEVVTHVAAARVLTAVRRSADSGTFKPVWIEKGELVANFYFVVALSEMMALGKPDGPLGLLFAYTPLPFMKTGRIRAPLNGLAERLSGPSFPRTLGGYAAAVLADPDETLPEHAALSAGDLDGMRTRFEEDPAGTADEVFGAYMLDRTQSEDPEMLMRVTSARINALEKDPSADDDTIDAEAENVALEDLVVGAAPLPLSAEEEAEVAALEAHYAEPAVNHEYKDDVADYVVAHAKQHLSPVIARAIATYRDQGANAATQEFKVTKAPRKTLTALGKFAKHGWSSVVLVFDQFADWDRIAQDMRLEIAASLMEMRWALEGSGVVVIMAEPGTVPEIAEQFAAAERASWEMPELDGLLGEDPPVDDIPLQSWLDACTVCGPSVSADDPVFATIRDRAQGSFKRFAELAGAACHDAILRGADRLDEASISEDALAAAAGGAEGEEGS